MGIFDFLFGSDDPVAPTVSNVTSPEQAQMWQMLKPIVQQIANRPAGGRLYDIPPAPSAVPYMQNADPNVLSPQGDWYGNLDPNIRQGIEAPYQRGANMLGEQLQNYGGASARGGTSGNMAAGLGNYWAQASPQMALQGWQMMQPSLQAQYNQPLMAGQADYQTGVEQWRQGLQESQYPYNFASGQVGGTYSTPVVQQQQQTPWWGNVAAGLGIRQGFSNLFG